MALLTGPELTAAECGTRVGKTGGPCIRVKGHGEVSPYEVVHIDEYGQRAISSSHPTRGPQMEAKGARGAGSAADPSLFDLLDAGGGAA